MTLRFDNAPQLLLYDKELIACEAYLHFSAFREEFVKTLRFTFFSRGAVSSGGTFRNTPLTAVLPHRVLKFQLLSSFPEPGNRCTGGKDNAFLPIAKLPCS